MRLRWEFAQRLARGEVFDGGHDLRALLPDPLPATVRELVAAAAARLLLRPLTAADWLALGRLVETDPNAALTDAFLEEKGGALMGLLLSAPQFQLR